MNKKEQEKAALEYYRGYSQAIGCIKRWLSDCTGKGSKIDREALVDSLNLMEQDAIKLMKIYDK